MVTELSVDLQFKQDGQVILISNILICILLYYNHIIVPEFQIFISDLFQQLVSEPLNYVIMIDGM